MKTVIIIIGLSLSMALTLFPGSVRISGIVTDSQNHLPMVDCHVYIQGTVVGTISDSEGKFSLKVPVKYKNKRLIISFLGYTTYKQPLASLNKRKLEIALDQTCIPLDEIIVRANREVDNDEINLEVNKTVR